MRVETRTPIPELINSPTGRVKIPLAHSVIDGLICGALGAIVAWGFFGSPRWGFWGGLLGVLGFAIGWYIARLSPEIYEVRVEMTPETAEQSPVAPPPPRDPAIHDWREHQRKAESGGRKRAFLTTCRGLKRLSFNTLVAAGWADKAEIARFRDELIDEGLLRWKNETVGTFENVSVSEIVSRGKSRDRSGEGADG